MTVWARGTYSGGLRFLIVFDTEEQARMWASEWDEA